MNLEKKKSILLEKKRNYFLASRQRETTREPAGTTRSRQFDRVGVYQSYIMQLCVYIHIYYVYIYVRAYVRIYVLHTCSRFEETNQEEGRPMTPQWKCDIGTT